jgi:cytochrome c2
MLRVADALLAALALACAGAADAAGPDRRGEAAIRAYGCGACHRIPGIAGARGIVGPPLERLRERAYIAGRLPSTPDNLARWIASPQHVLPGNAMPDLGVAPDDAQAIAAWLWRAP